MNKEEFVKEIKKLNIAYSTEMMEKLDAFYHFLTEWNTKINLTRITQENDVYLKHYYDSLTITKIMDLNKVTNLLDVGTGAGFPGIVLKIFYPHIKVTLIDSLQKRVSYLNLLIKHLNLKDIEVLHTRIENLSQIKTEKYDVVVSRAVASMPQLIEWLSPYINETGKIICMKANADEEIIKSQPILSTKALKISNIKTFYLPYEESLRTLIEISKK
jgi:16S rRNA (guanine527-N7)-methyltransferase